MRYNEKEKRLLKELKIRSEIPDDIKDGITAFVDRDTEPMRNCVRFGHWLLTGAPITVRNLITDIANERAIEQNDLDKNNCRVFTSEFNTCITDLTRVLANEEKLDFFIRQFILFGLVNSERQFVNNASRSHKKIITGCMLIFIKTRILYVVGRNDKILDDPHFCELQITRWFCSKFNISSMQERTRCPEECIQLAMEAFPDLKKLFYSFSKSLTF